jgi:hypothetical protein
LLRSIVGERLTWWDLALLQVQFANNSRINRSTGNPPFQIIYGRNPKGVVDLVQLPIVVQISEDAKSFAEHIQKV